MSNFDICYNALCRAFHNANVIMPPTLVKILKPDNVVHSSISLTNTMTTDSESDTTNNDTDEPNESDESDESDEPDESNNIDSDKSAQGNVNSEKYDDSVAYGSLMSQFSPEQMLNLSQRT